uniref:Uncharacterized protein n=1 Tax=Globodera rostochiensis TaxID=31243 RepID=A0A914GTT8_GLORO
MRKREEREETRREGSEEGRGGRREGKEEGGVGRREGNEEGRGGRREGKEEERGVTGFILREPSGGKRKWSPIKETGEEEGGKAKNKANLLDDLLETYCALLKNRVFAGLLLFAVCCYWYGAICGSLIIQPKLDTRKILPKGSKLQETFTLLERFVWADHLTVTVIVNGILNVSSTEEMKFFYKMVEDFERMPRSKGPKSSLVWLRDFEKFCRGEDGSAERMEEFLADLELEEPAKRTHSGAEGEKEGWKQPARVDLCRLEQFLELPFYAHWASFVRQHSDKNSACPSVHSFILMFAYQNTSNWEVRIDLMQQWRAIAGSRSRQMPWLNVTVWEQNSQFVDQMLSLPEVTVHSWLLTFICMLFVCALFVPNPFSVLIAGVSISSISVGVFGFLSWLHFDLDPITMAATLMSIGLSVDFTAHVTYHFRQAHRVELSTDPLTGFKNVRLVPLLNQEEKLKHTLAAVGWPMLQSGVSTALCISPLLFTYKYAPSVFACAVFLVSGWGLLHGLLVLPSVLCLLPAWCSSSRPFRSVAFFVSWRRKLRICNGKKLANGEENLGELVEGGELKAMKKLGRRLVKEEREI